MRPLVFRDVRRVDPVAGTVTWGHLRVVDGRIEDLAEGDLPGSGPAEIVDGDGFCLAPGLVDVGVHVAEPGGRHRESFRSAGAAAAAGGITTLVTRPDTDPAIDNPEALEFVRRRAAETSAVRILPMAALTRGLAGREMAEMAFLLDAGAVAFTDGLRGSGDTRAQARCLTYARELGAVVIGHPQDPALSAGAAATSGKFAALRGLPAVPAMAERIGLDRDLGLAEMTGARWHADQITTARALRRLSRAREAGLPVTSGVSIHHLTLNEYDVGDYRTFFRLTPPLRAETDRSAVVDAVATGLIDVVCSMHTPLDEESKRLPFEEAAPGAVGLETMLSAALRLVHAEAIDLPHLFAALSTAPSRLIGQTTGRLDRGAPADLVLFDPDAPYVLDRFDLRSKSKNTPFDGARMEGRVRGTWVAGAEVYRA